MDKCFIIENESDMNNIVFNTNNVRELKCKNISVELLPKDKIISMKYNQFIEFIRDIEDNNNLIFTIKKR